MPMSRGVRLGTVTIGILLSVFTVISILCGGVAVSKMTSPVAVTIGFWAFYFLIPAGVSILAGYMKATTLLAAALGLHVLGSILAIVGLALCAAFWAILSSTCAGGFEHCACVHSKKLYTYEASCSDLDTVRAATSGVSIMFALICIVSLTGAIYGCVGTCCAPRAPAPVVITTGQQPQTIVVTNSHENPHPHITQPPPAYPQGQVEMGVKY